MNPNNDQPANPDQDHADQLNRDEDDPEPMRQALIRLGLAPIAAQEFINNGITSTEELCVMSSDHLFHLIKQIHRDNMNGIFIPYKSQQCLEAILYWSN